MISKIIFGLEKYADRQRVEASKTMFPTKMRVIGVRAPDMKLFIRENWSEISKLAPEELITLTKELVGSDIFECNHLAFELLSKSKPALRLIGLEDLEQLGKNIDNWATTDAFSVMIAGWTWRNNQISDQDVINWLENGNLWWKRTAIVSTVALNLRSRGGKGDVNRTLIICEKALNDRRPLIQKALSWALSELSKSYKPAVVDFMNRHGEMLCGSARREIYTKLETGRKNPRSRV